MKSNELINYVRSINNKIHRARGRGRVGNWLLKFMPAIEGAPNSTALIKGEFAVLSIGRYGATLVYKYTLDRFGLMELESASLPFPYLIEYKENTSLQYAVEHLTAQLANLKEFHCQSSYFLINVATCEIVPQSQFWVE